MISRPQYLPENMKIFAFGPNCGPNKNVSKMKDLHQFEALIEALTFSK